MTHEKVPEIGYTEFCLVATFVLFTVICASGYTLQNWSLHNPSWIMVCFISYAIILPGCVMIHSDADEFTPYLGLLLITGSISAVFLPMALRYDARAIEVFSAGLYRTAEIMAGMGVLGLLFPRLFRSMAGALSSATIIIGIAGQFVEWEKEIGNIDTSMFFLTSVSVYYFAYVLHEAQKSRLTLNKAVLVGAVIYLSAISGIEYLMQRFGIVLVANQE